MKSNKCSENYIATNTQHRCLPFHGDTHHEAHTCHQTTRIDIVKEYYLCEVVLDTWHVNDHTEELNKVRNVKVDEIDLTDVTISHLKENKVNYKHVQSTQFRHYGFHIKTFHITYYTLKTCRLILGLIYINKYIACYFLN